MWPGCQAVGTTRSAQAGTASSIVASTTNPGTHQLSGAASNRTQPTWHAAIPAAYRSAPARVTGSWAAARSHWATALMRMTTYPATATLGSRSSRNRGTPAAKTRTPAICANTSRRKAASSGSYADANQVKFIHAHQMAKNTRGNATSASAAPPPTSKWCIVLDAWATATTKVRSKNSSSGVEARCCSSGSRDVIVVSRRTAITAESGTARSPRRHSAARDLGSAAMSEWGTRGVAPTVCLLALAASAWTGCGQEGDGPVRQPARLTPAAPQAPLVPGVVPEGFVVEGASMGEAVDDGDRALLIGPADGELGPGARPVIVVGQSDGSASMAGPSTAGGEVVDEPGAPDSFHPVIVDDGPWTWVIFHDEMCLDDCRFYVAGRDVARDDLIAVARGTTYEDAGPVVDPEAVPNGMAPLLTAEPADGIVTHRGSRITLLSSDGSGQIELQQVDGVPELAALWGFWVDDAQGTPTRGGTGWSGPVGATYE